VGFHCKATLQRRDLHHTLHSSRHSKSNFDVLFFCLSCHRFYFPPLGAILFDPSVCHMCGFTIVSFLYFWKLNLIFLKLKKFKLCFSSFGQVMLVPSMTREYVFCFSYQAYLVWSILKVLSILYFLNSKSSLSCFYSFFLFIFLPNHILTCAGQGKLNQLQAVDWVFLAVCLYSARTGVKGTTLFIPQVNHHC